MPCSRIEAPLAQCAPRLIGESNTGSWRTHTPFSTTASMAQPTEQCVQTVRFTSTLTASALAPASPIMLNGSWEATGAGAERDARAAQERAAVHRLGEHALQAAREARLRERKRRRIFWSAAWRPPQTLVVR